MAKLTLADVSNILGNPTSAANTLNSNNTLIETALENTLSRDGTTPNQMSADIDMNNNDLLNVDNIDANVLVLNGSVVQPVDLATALKISNALSELPAAGLDATARTNLGLGSAATQPSSAFATAAQGLLADTSIQPEDTYLSVENFSGADDNAKFSAAITAAAALGNGATVFVPRRNTPWSIVQKTVPQNVKILLDKGAVIQASGATASLFNFTGGLSGISGGLLVNPSALATDAILITKPADNLFCDIHNIYFSQFTRAVRVNSGDCTRITDNTGVSNGTFVHVINDGRNSTISGNYAIGGNGVNIQKTSQGAEGVRIFDNAFLPANGTYCVNLGCGLEIQVFNNIFDQVITGPAISIDGQVNAIQNIKITNNWIGRQLGAATADYGLYAVGNVRGLISENNTYVGWRQAGLNLNGLAGGAMLYNKSINDHFYIADPCVRDIQLTFCENVEVRGAKFSGTASLVENTGCTGRVEGCDWTASTRPSSVSLGLRYGRQLAGMVLRNKGTATLAQTTRVATVNHGLNYTPADIDIKIEANGFAVNAPGEFVADTIGATTFRGVCRNDPGAGGCAVKWEVNMER